MVRFLPPGLLCRWAWHTGLQTPDSQISSPLAQWSWAANPLPPVFELRCSANDRVLEKKISLIPEIRQVVITLPCLLSVPPCWLRWPYIIPPILSETNRAVCLTSSTVRLEINEKSPVVSRGNSLNFSSYIPNIACLQAKGRVLKIYLLMSLSDCRVFGGHCWTTYITKCFSKWACVLWQPNKQNKSASETNLGYEHDEKIRLTAKNNNWMPLPVKVKAKMRERLFVDRYRAKVTVTDVSGNRSDMFNPDVSTGPKWSQEFFPFKVATAESCCLLC